MTAVNAALAARSESLRSFRVRGSVRDLGGGASSAYTFRFRQPRYARVDVDGGPTIIFDGDAFLELDPAEKVATKVQREAETEERFLWLVHQVFSPLACEGWRPPLLRPAVTRAEPRAAPDGPRWVVTVPADDALVKEVRIELRAQDASFLRSETLDGAGNVLAFTKVLEEHVDEASGGRYPRKWEHRSSQGHREVTLTEIEINPQLPTDVFSTAVPPGFTERTPP